MMIISSSEDRPRASRTSTNEKLHPETRSHEPSIEDPNSQSRISDSRQESASKIRDPSRQGSINSQLRSRDNYENEDRFPQGPSKQSSSKSISLAAAGQSHSVPSFIRYVDYHYI